MTYDSNTFNMLHLSYDNYNEKPINRSLIEAREEIRKTIYDSISNSVHQFTLIKSDVGTGKSFIANSLLAKFPNLKILVLVKRLENYENYPNFKPLPFLPEELKAYFKLHRKSEMNSYQIFEKMEPKTDEARKLKSIYLNYKETDEKILKENQFIVTTHSKFIQGSLKSENLTS